MKTPFGRHQGRIVETHANRCRRAQGGAALIVALVLLLVVSLISITGANETLLDQHMASNQYVQTNSFLAAEAGLTEARELANDSTIKQAVAVGDADKIESAWSRLISQYESWNALGGNGSAQFKITRVGGHDSYWDADKQAFAIASHGGMIAGASILSQRTLGAEIAPPRSNDSGSSPFVSAVVGREGVSVTGGSRPANLDTYNSRYGTYGSKVTVDGKTFTNRSSSDNSGDLEGGSARTCAADATITLSGGTPIYGDVLGTGDLISQNDPIVHGNVHVNGDANFNGHIYGNLIAGGNVYLGENTYITGDVIAGGDVEVVGGSYGKPESIRAGGTITYPSYYNSVLTDQYIDSLSASELDIDPVASSPTGCGSDQSRAIAAKFSAVRNNSGIEALADWLDDHGCITSSCYSVINSSVTLSGNNGKLTIGTAGKQTLLEADSNIEGSLAQLTILGHVTLLVEGNFTLSGDTTLDVGPSATLTLLVTGKTRFGNSTDVTIDGSFVREGADGESTTAILVDSTYASRSSSDVGIEISGASDAYIAIYAPDTTVEVGSSGDVYGSVVAKYINASGSGSIHYDEALKKVSVGNGSDSESTDAEIASWWQTLS